MNLKLDVAIDSATEFLHGMLDRAKMPAAWLNRVAYPELLRIQRRRWETEGASEGDPWLPLNDTYRAKKLKMFRDYPGRGTKMLVATGRLIDSMTKPGDPDHYKLVTEKRIEVGTQLEYAKFVGELRDITTLSQDTVDELLSDLGIYLTESGQ